MTPVRFLRNVMLLYGDHWQKPLAELLDRHGHQYTRQSFWNWKAGKRRVPEAVEVILKKESKQRKQHTAKGIAP